MPGALVALGRQQRIEQPVRIVAHGHLPGHARTLGGEADPGLPSSSVNVSTMPASESVATMAPSSASWSGMGAG